MKEKKKNIFDNIGLKLLALLIAFLMWFVVMNYEDGVVTKTISGIPVEMINGDSIIANGNLYNVTDGESVEIIVRGPRSIVENLEANDFVATADLSHLSVTNSTTIDVITNSNIPNSSAKKLTITPVNQYVTLSIEEESEKSIPVRVITTGDAKEGYAAGNPVPTPNMVTVTGPESVLANIVEARAVIDVSGAEKDIVEIVNLGCIDGYGSAVQKDNISLSASTVSVNVPIYQTKTVNINVNTAGKLKDGYGIKAINYEPSSIVIAGASEDLESIDSIDINDVIVTDADSNIEKNIDLTNYLSNDVFLADESVSDLAVNVEIEAMKELDITVAKNKIRIIGGNPDYNYDIVSPDNIKVKLNGFEEDISGLSIDDINPRINVKDLNIGENEMTVDFDTKDIYEIKDSYSVKVEVSKVE